MEDVFGGTDKQAKSGAGGDDEFDKKEVFTDAQTSRAHAVMRMFPDDRSDEDIALVWEWLANQPVEIRKFFNMAAKKEYKDKLAKRLTLLSSSPGTLIFRQGEIGDNVYFILEGNCEVIHRPLPDLALMARYKRKVADEDAASSKGKAIAQKEADEAQAAADAAEAAGGSMLAPIKTESETGAGGALLSAADKAALGYRVGVLPAGECFGEDTAGEGRRDCTVLSMGAVAVDGSTVDALLLQVDGDAFHHAVNPVWTGIEADLKRRTRHLRKLNMFEDWSDQDLTFIAHWMEEEHRPKKGVVYNRGDAADAVYFMRAGTVALQVEMPGMSEPYVVETVSAPAFFGDMDLVNGAGIRDMTAVVVDTGGKPEATYSVISANVFQRLTLSAESAAMYATSEKLQKLAKNRAAWHAMRQEDAGDSGDLSFALLADIQARFIGCVLCGKPNHTVMECPTNPDGDAYRPPAEDTPRSGTTDKSGDGSDKESGPGSPSGSGRDSPGFASGGLGGSKKPAPIGGAEVGRLALLANSSAGAGLASPKSPGGQRGSVSPLKLPQQNMAQTLLGEEAASDTVRSSGSWGSGKVGTPRERAPPDGDDWNDDEKPDSKPSGLDALDTETKLFLANARTDIRMVMKAVWGFKRLVKVRRAEREAYRIAIEAGEDETKARLKSKVAGRLASVGAEADLDKLLGKVASDAPATDPATEAAEAKKAKKLARAEKKKAAIAAGRTIDTGADTEDSGAESPNSLSGTLTPVKSEGRISKVLARTQSRRGDRALRHAGSSPVLAGSGSARRLRKLPSSDHDKVKSSSALKLDVSGMRDGEIPRDKDGTPRRKSAGITAAPLSSSPDARSSSKALARAGSSKRVSATELGMPEPFPTISGAGSGAPKLAPITSPTTSPTNARKKKTLSPSASAKKLAPLKEAPTRASKK